MFRDTLIIYSCYSTNRNQILPSPSLSLFLCLSVSLPPTHTHAHVHVCAHKLNSAYWRWRAWDRQPLLTPAQHTIAVSMPGVKILTSIHHFHWKESQLFEEMADFRAKARKIKHLEVRIMGTCSRTQEPAWRSFHWPNLVQFGPNQNYIIWIKINNYSEV